MAGRAPPPRPVPPVLPDPGTALLLVLSGVGLVILPWLARGTLDNGSWGADLWRYFPPGYARLASIVCVALLVWGTVTARRAHRTVPAAEPRPRRGAAPATATAHGGDGARMLAVRVAVVGLFGAVLWIARERLHFLGDTHLRLRSIAAVIEGRSLREVLSLGRAAPLDEALQIYGSGAVAARLGIDAEFAGQAMSCLIGVGYAIVAMRLAARLFERDRSRLLATAVLLTPGYVQLFAGYAENYGLQILVLAGWCGAIIAEAHSRRAPLASHVWMALAVLVHRDALLILPAHLWAWWRRPPPAGATSPQRGGPRTFFGAVAIAAALAVLVIAWLPQLGQDLGFLLGAGPPDPRNVALFSRHHLGDVLNEMFLLGPVTLLGALLLPDAWRRVPEARPLILAGLPFGIVALVVRSNFHGLGAVRDWDAFAPAGFFLCVVAAVALGEMVARRPERTRLAVACVMAGAFSSAAWLAVNASSERALSRAERVAYGTPRMQKAPHALALDALATIHERRGDHLAAARDRVSAAELFANARYLWAAGISYWKAGAPDSARPLFDRAARNPEFRADLVQLAGGRLGPAPEDPLLFAMWSAVREAEQAAPPEVAVVAVADSARWRRPATTR